jgi:hypothetical protein
MDPITIIALIGKGLTVAEALMSAGQSAAPAIKVMWNLITGSQNGTLTDQQLTDEEATLDGMIADFNQPI